MLNYFETANEDAVKTMFTVIQSAIKRRFPAPEKVKPAVRRRGRPVAATTPAPTATAAINAKVERATARVVQPPVAMGGDGQPYAPEVA